MALLLLLAVGAGCQAQGSVEDPAVGPDPDIEGYVVKRETGRMLVVAPDREAIWFTSVPAKARVGQMVQVWYSVSEESYPARAKADRVTIVLSPKPSGADLSAADAVREALVAYESVMAPAVQRVDYDAAADIWDVRVQVEDGGEDVKQVKDEL